MNVRIRSGRFGYQNPNSLHFLSPLYTYIYYIYYIYYYMYSDDSGVLVFCEKKMVLKSFLSFCFENDSENNPKITRIIRTGYFCFVMSLVISCLGCSLIRISLPEWNPKAIRKLSEWCPNMAERGLD